MTHALSVVHSQCIAGLSIPGTRDEHVSWKETILQVFLTSDGTSAEVQLAQVERRCSRNDLWNAIKEACVVDYSKKLHIHILRMVQINCKNRYKLYSGTIL